MKNKALLVLCLLGMFANRAAFADEFVSPTYGNLINVLVRYGALDLRDKEVLNSYANINECELYKQFYFDEFKWHDLQIALRKSIRERMETFPTGVYYKTELQLGKYDFKNHVYLFTSKTSPKNSNVFTLDASKDSLCDTGRNLFPVSFQLVLDQPLSINGLPFNEEEGKALLTRLNDAHNSDHILYARFNMRVLYVAPLKRGVNKQYGEPRGDYMQERHSGHVRIDSHLTSVDLFEDKEMTKLVYSFRP